MFSTILRFAVLCATLAAVKAQSGDCPCPPVPPGPWQLGVPINAVPAPPSAIECAYPDGACVWDAVSSPLQCSICVDTEEYTQTGALLNTNQTNCQSHIDDATSCPKDNTGASGQLINHLRSFECVNIDETGFHPDFLCVYNAVSMVYLLR